MPPNTKPFFDQIGVLNLIYVLVGLLVIASGCSRDSAPVTVPAKPVVTLLITNFGEFVYDAGNWTVSVSERDGTISAAYTRSYAGKHLAGLVKASSTVSASVSPVGWRTNSGWCAFIESPTRLWAYDGITNLWILEQTDEGSASYGITSLPAQLPSEIALRLSPQARQLVESKSQE